MKIAIIDGDSIGYSIGWVNKDKGPDDMMQIILSVDEYMNRMIKKSGCTHIMGFLEGIQPNFRALSANVGQVFETGMKQYKESRQRDAGEGWYMKNFFLITHRLRTKYGFKNVEFVESDDAVIIMANRMREAGTDHVICSPDKDLKQFPGSHYDYAKDEMIEITEEEAEYNFWMQMVTGDTTDDVEGIPGLGPVKAKKFLNGVKPEYFKDNVLTLYQAAFGERVGVLRYAMTFNYLRMLREPAYHFDPSQYTPLPVHGLIDPEETPEKVDVSEVFNNIKNE
ncbi:MAG: hypothetical protein JSW41_05665 [Candidatus Aenigmatarchaeota archaeon]|nr:MAG: hypothetical protein JSW41_05665 [Candidatus Aenigmarchaeota archaeon]